MCGFELGEPTGVRTVDEFVVGYVDSFTAWDILTLFGSSPNRLAHPADIAQLVGRPEPAVEACLRALAEKGFFEVEHAPGRAYYHWHPDEELQTGLDQFIKATADRKGRLKALSLLLRKLGSSGPRSRLE